MEIDNFKRFFRTRHYLFHKKLDPRITFSEGNVVSIVIFDSYGYVFLKLPVGNIERSISF